MRRFLVLTLLLAVALVGCAGQGTGETAPVSVPLSTRPILPVTQETLGDVRTPVYATVFGDTVILATYPVLQWQDYEEPDCPEREISQGGAILRGCEHEQLVPVTTVLIVEVLAPESTRGWFSGMTELTLVEGIEKLDTQFVTDMTDMFRDCYQLQELPQWYPGE